ncbi:MAG: Dockerin type 1 [Aureobasidium pullulans]|nr:MAG: Dockerin type 1 [Aureobasidium pullulans]THY42066.1 hypothetical protein D6C97_09661 [Aureobasidium pullulans]TIA52247.1 hypothetical protein D6C77_08579 [Aureobasidium pullulans]
MPDPLQILPAEIILRCIEFTPLSGVAALNSTTKSWHSFLETTHQDAIYSQQAHQLYNKHPRSDREVTQLSRDYKVFGEAKQDRSFVQYFRGVESWKDFCKRLALLQRNWNSNRPVVRESIVQVGYDPVWRFKPDFKRRFIVSTSQAGGVCVTDMDNGRMLWRLRREDVRMCAHLEYDQDSGTACWDRFGNAVEVWKADEVERGTFHRVAILNHDCETRGFQLSRFNDKETLCIVSSEGKGFVWDLSVHPPQQRKVLDIENEAVGHLDQGENTVMYSMGPRGYHVCSKTTGEIMGKLEPKDCPNIFHIAHPPPQSHTTMGAANHGPTARVCPPEHPRKDRLRPLKLYNGAHPVPRSPLAIENDEWGSGIISGNYMAGVSRAGRIFICTDFLGALADPARFRETTAILHTEGDGSTFELGGWLSIKNGRAIFEIIDSIYIFTMPDFGKIPETGEAQRPIWATPISSAPQLAVPVSFMGIYDDCIMHTYTTLGFRSLRPRRGSNGDHAPNERSRAFPTKAIRILSLAPNLARPGKELSYLEGMEVHDNSPRSSVTNQAPRTAPATRGLAQQAGILQLMALLTGNEGDDDEEEDEEEEEEIDEDTRERLEMEIEEDERREWEEYAAFEQEEEMRERQELADMMGLNDDEGDMEMLRSDEEGENAAPRAPYAPSLDDDDDDDWEDEDVMIGEEDHDPLHTTWMAHMPGQDENTVGPTPDDEGPDPYAELDRLHGWEEVATDVLEEIVLLADAETFDREEEEKNLHAYEHDHSVLREEENRFFEDVRTGEILEQDQWDDELMRNFDRAGGLDAWESWDALLSNPALSL